MKWNPYLIVFVPFIMVALYSCSEEIPWNPGVVEKKLVVDGGISTELKQHKIKLSSTLNFNDTIPNPVNDAAVFVSEGDKIYEFKEKDDLGEYISIDSFQAQTGVEYKMSIVLKEDISGETRFFASTTINQGMDIDSIGVVYDVEVDSLNYELILYGQEPVGKEHVYEIKITLCNDVCNVQNTDLSTESFFNDKVIDGQYLIRAVHRDDPYSSFNVTIDTISESMALVTFQYDSISLELETLSSSYGEYLISSLNQLTRLEDFLGVLGPAANIEGNISGGALGYFNGTYVSKETLTDGVFMEQVELNSIRN